MSETTPKSSATDGVSKIKAILARKVGMTQLFDAQGLARPATELEAGPCPVVSLKTKEKDGYTAVVLGFGPATEKSTNQAQLGVFKKAGVSPHSWLREVRTAQTPQMALGDLIKAGDVFQIGDYVDVAGVSKGKGFAGGVKRWNFRGGPKTHGQSDRERAPGSLAGRRSLGRVLPGKKMAGHLGQENVVVKKIEVLKIDAEANRLYVGGGVPGAKGSFVMVSGTTARRKHVAQVHPHAKASKKKGAPAKGEKAAAPAKKEK